MVPLPAGGACYTLGMSTNDDRANEAPDDMASDSPESPVTEVVEGALEKAADAGDSSSAAIRDVAAALREVAEAIRATAGGAVIPALPDDLPDMPEVSTLYRNAEDVLADILEVSD